MNNIRFRTKLIFFTIAFFLTLVIRSRAEIRPSDIFDKYSPAVITIIALDENDQPLSLGSGFFIDENGHIATNYHVIENCSKAVIKTKNGEKGYLLKIIKYDSDFDLVVAKTSIETSQYLPLGDSDTVIIGEDVLAIGNPAGLEGTISNGIISGVRNIDNINFIQITAPISPGSSGGPVFNLSGKVIGVATAYLDYGQSLNFAMPINYLKSLKPNIIDLVSLPKYKKKKVEEKDHLLVKAFDVFYSYIGYKYDNNLSQVEFSIKNDNNYPINNIILFFVYKNPRGDIINYSSMKIEETILPKLAHQFVHNTMVRNFRRWDPNIGKKIEGKVEIRILNYEIKRMFKLTPVD